VPDGVSEALGNAKLWATGTKVFALAWLGVLSSAAVLAAESVAVGKLSSSETAVVFSTEPLWAAAMGSLMLGEQIGANTFVGGALVLAACISRVASPQELSTLWQTKMGEARSTLEKARFPSK
jgi:drug/metabolite transporter (DMT)-like permease